MYCKNCGEQIADDSRFCLYCGTRLFDDAPRVNPRIFEMETPSFDDEPEEEYIKSETASAAETAQPEATTQSEEHDYEKHHTQHVKKEYQYGDFGADLSERFKERKEDRKLDRQARRAADPEKYAKRDFKKARARKVWAIVIGVVVVAWAIGRLRVLIG